MTIRTTGLKETVAAFRKIDKQAGYEATGVKSITGGLREIAKVVRAKSREIAAQKGFTPPGRSGRGTGSLINSLSYSVRGGSAYITEGAENDRGYPYPAVFEYGKTSPWQKGGVRSFMEPAIEIEEPFIMESLEKLLDAIAGDAGF